MPDKDISHLVNDESFLNYCFSRNENDSRQWEKWLSENPEYRARVEELKSLIIALAHEVKLKESEEQFALLKQRISSSATFQVKPESHGYPLYMKLAFAASLFIIGTFGVLIYQGQRNAALIKAGRLIKNDIKPGGYKAYLTLSNGKKISLTNAANGAIAKQSGIVITKTSDGKLIYTVSDLSNNTSASEYNTIETPRGGQYQVRLPDGTNVWLNAASSLKYPVNFVTKNERRVELDGEGYFEVAKDKAHPFIVKAAQQEVKVLGTNFNVKAYNDEPNISTTLLEGSVLVNDLSLGQQELLRPGQQSNVFVNSTPIDVSNVNPSEVLAWKSGYFIFDNQDIISIMKVISRWYNVDVEYNSFNKDERFGGTFSRSANLSEILHNLELLGKIHFKIEGRRVIISNIY